MSPVYKDYVMYDINDDSKFEKIIDDIGNDILEMAIKTKDMPDNDDTKNIIVMHAKKYMDEMDAPNNMQDKISKLKELDIFIRQTKQMVHIIQKAGKMTSEREDWFNALLAETMMDQTTLKTEIAMWKWTVCLKMKDTVMLAIKSV